MLFRLENVLRQMPPEGGTEPGKCRLHLLGLPTELMRDGFGESADHGQKILGGVHTQALSCQRELPRQFENLTRYCHAKVTAVESQADC
ncbi:MAG TPA: hypothetical protein VF017_16005 [Thermoanaerobaculia bacterium]|nr:hypothetical protein [Thermoanaerobaculia bacterium]